MTSALRSVLTGLLAGAAIGAVTGAIDQILRALHPALAAQRSVLLASMVMYALPWALLGGAVVLAWRRDRTRAACVIVPAWGSAAALLVLGGGWANIHWLGSLFALRSLVFDLLAVVVCVALAFVLQRGPAARPLARVATAATVMLVVTLGVGVVVSRSTANPVRTGRDSVPAAGPDLLVVLFDALRADHCSVYGYERATTPTLEALARRGVRFDQAYAPSSWTKPSVATLFTGLYPSSHGNHRIGSRLPASARTLPEVLRDAGYRTGVFAENSFVSALFGYDRGVDHLVGNEPDVPAQTVLGHLLHQLAVRTALARPLLTAARWANPLDPRQAGRMGGGLDLPTAFLRWIDEVAPEDRFFAYVHLMKPHAPYVCPAPFDGAFGEPSGPGLDSPVDPPHVEGIAPFARAEPRGEEFRRRLVANYDERILYGDHLLARILDGLRDRGRERDLAILVLADHGEEFGEHGLWDHGHSLQQGAVRIPFLLVAPGRVPEGEVVTGPVRLLDAAPTLFDLAGVDAPDQFEGRSVLALAAPGIEDQTPLPRPVLATLEHGVDFRAEALITRGLKLVRSRDGAQRAIRVFDLARDPAEDHDLAQPGEDPLSWLEDELETALTAAARQRADADEAVLDPATEERLRALGYIQ